MIQLEQLVHLAKWQDLKKKEKRNKKSNKIWPLIKGGWSSTCFLLRLPSRLWRSGLAHLALTLCALNSAFAPLRLCFYAWRMSPSIPRWYPKHKLKICPRYTKGVHEICQRYPLKIHYISTRYPQDIQKISTRYLQSWPKYDFFITKKRFTKFVSSKINKSKK